VASVEVPVHRSRGLHIPAHGPSERGDRIATAALDLRVREDRRWFLNCQRLKSTAAKAHDMDIESFLFLPDLQAKKRADERTRTADLLQLRVIHQALQGFADSCKTRISRPISCPRFALCCTVLRSRWCQSGVNVVLVSAWQGCPHQAPFGSHRASPTSCD
jgi:hypothetical protein